MACLYRGQRSAHAAAQRARGWLNICVMSPRWSWSFWLLIRLSSAMGLAFRRGSSPCGAAAWPPCATLAWDAWAGVFRAGTWSMRPARLAAVTRRSGSMARLRSVGWLRLAEGGRSGLAGSATRFTGLYWAPPACRLGWLYVLNDSGQSCVTLGAALCGLGWKSCGKPRAGPLLPLPLAVAGGQSCVVFTPCRWRAGMLANCMLPAGCLALLLGRSRAAVGGRRCCQPSAARGECGDAGPSRTLSAAGG
mmetsp:Transcript_14241/g.36418  ORF Transcript_14241/g.36418 Transcript_14241/m.36418 type:complete len:249 (+) Transcript_14241:326-1072(+)